MSHDPMHVVRDACEAAGLEPRGPVHNFMAECPGHEDRSPSMHVSEGSDGRALLTCFAGCDTAAVVGALGLTWSDLFPDGHRHAGPRRPARRRVETEHPAVAVLAALSGVGIEWHRTSDGRLFTADRCPGCDERRPGALWVFAVADQARLTCWNGCGFDAILGALERELTKRERVTS